MSETKFTVITMSAPLDDWTGTRIIIRSKDCPGGVAAVIGGAEEYAPLLAKAPELYERLESLLETVSCTCTFPSDDCCPVSAARAVLAKVSA